MNIRKIVIEYMDYIYFMDDEDEDNITILDPIIDYLKKGISSVGLIKDKNTKSTFSLDDDLNLVRNYRVKEANFEIADNSLYEIYTIFTIFKPLLLF